MSPIDLKVLSEKMRADTTAALKKPPPIPCAGHWNYTIDGNDYDCDYAYAGHFGCEDCVVNGGRYDPRTGKSFAKRRKKR